jgi:hypothetical protein
MYELLNVIENINPVILHVICKAVQVGSAEGQPTVPIREGFFENIVRREVLPCEK